jgi:hypothetical protein
VELMLLSVSLRRQVLRGVRGEMGEQNCMDFKYHVLGDDSGEWELVAQVAYVARDVIYSSLDSTL